MEAWREIGEVDFDPFADDEGAIEAGPSQPGPEVNAESQPAKPSTVPPAEAPAAEVPAIEIPAIEPEEIPEVTFAKPKEKPAPPAEAWKEIGEVDFDPFAGEKERPGFTGSVAAGYSGGMDAMGGFIDMAQVARLPPEQQAAAMIAAGKAKPAEEPAEMMDISEIEGFGDAWEFFKEASGQTLGSLAAAGTVGVPVGGTIGAAAGAPAGGVGAIPGAIAGAGYATSAAFVSMGVGGTYQDLIRDEGVQRSLADGSLTPNQVFATAGLAGAAVGALDAIPAGKVFKQVTGGLTKEVAKKTLKSIVIGGLKTGGEEGATEAAQQAISEFSQAVAGGDYKTAERLWSVLNAGVSGAVGGTGPGLVGEASERNTPVEVPPKVDDQPDVAATTQPEGTSAETSPAAGVPTPGTTSAATPPPPAGATKQAQPGVTVSAAGGVDPTLAAAAPGAAAAATPAARPAAAAPVEDEYDIAEDTADEDIPEAIRTQTSVLKDMFTQEAETQRNEDKRRAASATRTPVVTGSDPAIAAALQGSAPPAAGRETLGTGIALTRPNPAVQPPAAAAETPLPAAAAAAPAPSPLPPVPETPAPPAAGPVPTQTAGPPVQPAPSPIVAAAPVAEPAAAEPVAAEPIAAFVSQPEPSPSLPTPPTVAPASLPTADLADALPPAVQVVVKKTRGKKSTEGPGLAPAETRTGEPPAASRLPAKAAAAAAAGKTRAVPITGPTAVLKRADVEAEKKARAVEAEGASARAIAETKREEERQAKRSPLARDAQKAADKDLQSRSTVTELEDYADTLEEIADQEAEAAPRAKAGDVARRIAARVEEDLAEKHEAHEAEKAKQESLSTKLGRRKNAAEKKTEAMAKAAAPQKKERGGAKKGKSAVGIESESDKSALRAYEAERVKPAADQDQLVMAWGDQYHQRAKVRGDARQKYTDRMQQIQQLRAATAAEKAEKAEAGVVELEPERKQVGSAVEKAAKDVPLTDKTKLPRNPQAAANAILENMRAFWKASQAEIKASGAAAKTKLNRTHNSPAENLAIFVNNVMKARIRALPKGISEEQDNSFQGTAEYYMARSFYEDGVKTGDFTELHNQIIGDGLGEVSREQAKMMAGGRGGVQRSWEESEDHNLSETMKQKHESMDFVVDAPDTQERRRKSANTAYHEIHTPDEVPSVGGRHTIEVMTPGGRGVIVKNARTQKASKVLDELARQVRDEGGFISILRSFHIKHLKQLVGDVDVHIVPHDAIVKLSDPSRAHLGAASGLYFNYSNEDRALGARPMVFINEMELLDPDQYAHTVLHELTHAATSQAIRDGVNSSGKIFDAIRAGLKADLLKHYTEAELRDAGITYAFKDNYEFIAEAMTNPVFQEVLARMEMPMRQRLSVAGLTRGRIATWWDAVTAAVSKAIGMISGSRGNTYMEQVLKVYPTLARSEAQQQVVADDAMWGKPMPRAHPSGPADVQMLIRGVQENLEGLTGDMSESFSSWKRAKGALFATTGELIRRLDALTGDINNPLSKKAKLLLRKDPLRNAYKALSHQVQVRLLELKKTNREAYNQLGEISYEGTRFGIDPRVALSDPANKHIFKSGIKHQSQREEHARLHAMWQALPDNAKAVGDEMLQYYKTSHEAETRAHVTQSVQAALHKYRQPLPAGKNVDDVIEWVMSGDAARTGDERTSVDRAMHAALGKTGEMLAGITKARALKGIYVPLMRKGKYYFTAREKIDVPPGGVRDPSSKEGNRILFKDKDAVEDFVDSSPHMVKTSVMYVDPQTGERGSHLNENHVKVYVATVQNKRMEMHDSERELMRRRKEAQDAGATVSKVLEAGTLYDGGGAGAEALSSPQLQRMLANAEQTAGGSSGSNEMVRNAIIDLFVRQMTNPGHLQRRLKRQGVMGYDNDLVESIGEYSNSVSHHMANLEMQPQFAQVNREWAEFLKDQAGREYGTGPNMLKIQTIARELETRVNNPHQREGGDTKMGRAADAFMNITFMRHLFSLHYTIVNSLGPIMTTYPMLAAKYGEGGTWREMQRAARVGGVFTTLGIGFKESWKHTKTLTSFSRQHITDAQLEGWGLHDKRWYNMAGAEKDGRQLQAAIRALNEMGLGSSSGLEYGTLDDSGNKAEKILRKLTNVAKALPEAAEANNRYITLIAAYRLAVGKGMDHEHALNSAVLDVEQSQGGYAKANNPNFFANPYLRWPLQFKKYGLMYGQAFYGSLHDVLHFDTDRETRIIAAKRLARMAAVTVVFAGAGGLPFMEIARMFATVAMLCGLTDSDWDDDEQALQKWLSSFLGDTGGEVAMKGLTRLLGVDTSANLGAENLLTFGAPESAKDDDIFAWMGRMVGGAPGGMTVEMFKHLQEGDLKGAVPWPKFVKSMMKAYDEYSEGTVDKRTGEQYAKPTSLVEAGWRAAGFTPRSSAKQWEYGGSGATNKKLSEGNRERKSLMARWRNAKPAEQQRIFRQEVREWNKNNKDPKDRIDYSDLMASKRSAERRKKQLKEAQEED
jgi:hypothetical protein